jgi:hypothetical protein
MIQRIVRLPPIEPRCVKFGLSQTQDDDGSDLREFLALELIYEAVYKARLRLVHLLATLGVAVWLTSAWHDLVSPTLREALLWTMGFLILATMAVAVLEWHYFSRRQRQLARLTLRSRRWES